MAESEVLRSFQREAEGWRAELAEARRETVAALHDLARCVLNGYMTAEHWRSRCEAAEAREEALWTIIGWAEAYCDAANDAEAGTAESAFFRALAAARPDGEIR